MMGAVDFQASVDMIDVPTRERLWARLVAADGRPPLFQKSWTRSSFLVFPCRRSAKALAASAESSSWEALKDDSHLVSESSSDMTKRAISFCFLVGSEDTRRIAFSSNTVMCLLNPKTRSGSIKNIQPLNRIHTRSIYCVQHRTATPSPSLPQRWPNNGGRAFRT